MILIVHTLFWVCVFVNKTHNSLFFIVDTLFSIEYQHLWKPNRQKEVDIKFEVF